MGRQLLRPRHQRPQEKYAKEQNDRELELGKIFAPDESAGNEGGQKPSLGNQQ